MSTLKRPGKDPRLNPANWRIETAPESAEAEEMRAERMEIYTRIFKKLNGKG